MEGELGAVCRWQMVGSVEAIAISVTHQQTALTANGRAPSVEQDAPACEQTSAGALLSTISYVKSAGSLHFT